MPALPDATKIGDIDINPLFFPSACMFTRSFPMSLMTTVVCNRELELPSPVLYSDWAFEAFPHSQCLCAFQETGPQGLLLQEAYFSLKCLLLPLWRMHLCAQLVGSLTQPLLIKIWFLLYHFIELIPLPRLWNFSRSRKARVQAKGVERK